MAKSSYLTLTNKVLRRATQDAISDVSTATGTSLIVTELINEAQNELFTEINWYSLYKSRAVSTEADTAEVAVASDFGRGLILLDTTNNKVIVEDYIRSIDAADPDVNTTGTPDVFTIQADNYYLYPIPSGVFSLVDKYWKIPDTLSSSDQTSDLPIECENCIILYALAGVLQFLKEFNNASLTRGLYLASLKKAKVQNKKRINKMNVFLPQLLTNRLPLAPVTIY